MKKNTLKRICVLLTALTAFALFPMAAMAGPGVSAVSIVSMDVSASPFTTVIAVTMPDLGLTASDFSVANSTNPSNAPSVTNVSYADGQYSLTVSGMTYYDDYTLSVFYGGNLLYTDDSFYGTLAAVGDLDFEHELNMYASYTRALTEPGIATISNDTYTVGTKLSSGSDYTAIDSNNGYPDNGTTTRVIGIFIVAPAGAKGVKVLKINGTMAQVTEDSLIDGHPNYQETVQSGKDYYNAHKDDPGFVDSNKYFETIAFLPVYSHIASARLDGGARELLDPDDRFRIIEWYDNAECTGTPMKVTRLMVKVQYATPAPSGNVYTVDPPVFTGGSSKVTGSGAALSIAAYSGTFAISERGFVYGTAQNPSIGGAGVTKVVSGNGDGSYEASLTGLAANTLYYVRAYVISGGRIYYGDALTFTSGAAANVPNTGSEENTVGFAALTGAVLLFVCAAALKMKEEKR